jgi:phage shock protein A
MKQRGQQLFSEAGENFDYLRDNLRGLSQYIDELEQLVEDYRAYLTDDQTSSTMDGLVKRYKLLKRTDELFGKQDEKE